MSITLEGLIILVVIGAIAGWLAGQLVKGFGFGLVGNIIVGVVGAAIASFLFPAIGVSIGSGIIGSIINATIGAVLLLIVIRVVKRA
ncbi:MAG: GlsB/YeaQ/YmgE family stress response membrane protein [Paracoccaceae bacterium]